jgi:hypothetical protein
MKCLIRNYEMNEIRNRASIVASPMEIVMEYLVKIFCFIY